MKELFKFGLDVKSRAGLYSILILFFTCVCNLFLGIETISIYLLLEAFIACFIMSLIEYFLFLHYDDLSKKKKNIYTIIWALSLNMIIIFSALVFGWFQSYPIWMTVTLFIVIEIALIFFRYSIYVQNYYDTKDLNERLHKYQIKK